jgi:GT2 family glycosyltransferase
MTRLTVVIVTYNSAERLDACLRSAVGCLPPHSSIVVVDNASSDESADIAARTPGVTLVRNHRNLGFGAACNQGAAAAPALNYLFLNPDTQLASSIEPLIDAASRPGYGAAAGLLLDPSGQPQRGFSVRALPTPAALSFEALGLNRLLPFNPVNRTYRCATLDCTQPADVEQPAGAFLLLTHDAWIRIGGFNETFHPVWFEDVDLCARLRQQGLKIRFVPQVQATHSGGHSVKKLPATCRVEYWYGSLLRYVSLHFQPVGRNSVFLSIVVAVLIRGAFSLLRNPGWVSVRPYASILKMIGTQLQSDWTERRQPLTYARGGEARTAVE